MHASHLDHFLQPSSLQNSSMALRQMPIKSEHDQWLLCYIQFLILQGVLEGVFRFYEDSFFTCSMEGCRKSRPLSQPFPQWILHLGVTASSACTLEDLLEEDMFAKRKEDAPTACEAPGSTCGKVYGSTSRRITRLPQTLLINLKRAAVTCFVDLLINQPINQMSDDQSVHHFILEHLLSQGPSRWCTDKVG